MAPHYIGTEEELNIIDAQISSNCGWPSGGTTRWAEPIETTTSGVYAIPVPSNEGSHGFTQAEMISGVSGTISDTVELVDE